MTWLERWVAWPVQGPVLVALCAVAAGCDLRKGIIPNRLTLLALAVALVLSFAHQGWEGLVVSALGALVVSIAPLFLFVRGGLGGGDVKLLAGIGALVGAGAGLELEFLAFLMAAVWGLARLATVRRLGAFRVLGRAIRTLVRRSTPTGDSDDPITMRFGPAVLAAAVVLAVGRAFPGLAGHFLR